MLWEWYTVRLFLELPNYAECLLQADQATQFLNTMKGS
jgi:hypothetical protein